MQTSIMFCSHLNGFKSFLREKSKLKSLLSAFKGFSVYAKGLSVSSRNKGERFWKYNQLSLSDHLPLSDIPYFL